MSGKHVRSTTGLAISRLRPPCLGSEAHRSRLRLLAAAIALTAALVGCSIYASVPDISRYLELKPGVSTLADAERLMGKPTSTETGPGQGLVASWVDNGRAVALGFDASGRYLGRRVEVGF